MAVKVSLGNIILRSNQQIPQLVLCTQINSFDKYHCHQLPSWVRP